MRNLTVATLVESAMVSTVITLTVLVALFLTGIKCSIDVVREWPHRKSIARWAKKKSQQVRSGQ
jgi:hypothetical protein